MGGYSLYYKPSVEKDLRRIQSSLLSPILKKIEQLSSQPITAKSVKLAGSDSYYRIRVGDYRIIYAVDHSLKQVTVHYIRHRRDVYRSL
jgi:mRNA interferase RelE/StbE